MTCSTGARVRYSTTFNTSIEDLNVFRGSGEIFNANRPHELPCLPISAALDHAVATLQHYFSTNLLVLAASNFI